MPKYMVICDFLRIRTGPSTSYEYIGQYCKGEIIKSGGYPFEGEDEKIWVSYTAARSGSTRYVCYNNGSNQYLKQIKNQTIE